MLGRLPEAGTDLAKALRNEPRFLQAWSNRGNLFLKLQQPEAALAAFEKAMAFGLVMSRRSAGAPSRSNIWVRDGSQGFRRGLGVRSRLGSRQRQQSGTSAILLSLPDRAPMSLFCRKSLRRLFKGLDRQIKIANDADANERFDYQIALSSLPRAFKTRLATILQFCALGAKMGGADRLTWFHDRHLLARDSKHQGGPGPSCLCRHICCSPPYLGGFRFFPKSLQIE
jgi:tetratricopeptide (TPR) repeat protein